MSGHGRRALAKRIGAEIKRVRTEIMRCTQTEATDRVFGPGSGMQGQWSKYERGVVLPDVVTLVRIADAAGVPLSVFGVPVTDALGPGQIDALRYHLRAALTILDGEG